MNSLSYLPYSNSIGGHATPINLKVFPNYNNYWRIYVVGDPHIEHSFTSKTDLHKYVEYIAEDPHSVVIVVGDLIDASFPDGPFFSPSQIDEKVLVNLENYLHVILEEIEDVFSPLKNKSNVVILSGNHDIRLKYANLSYMVAERMGWVYGWYSALINVEVILGKNKRKHRSIFAHHGAGGGMYPGGKVNRMQTQLPNIADADFYVQGHVHDSISRVINIEKVVMRNGKPTVKLAPRTFLSAPAWLKGRPFYIQRKGTARTDERVVIAQVEENTRNKDIEFEVRLIEWKPDDVPLPYLDKFIEDLKKEKEKKSEKSSKSHK